MSQKENQQDFYPHGLSCRLLIACNPILLVFLLLLSSFTTSTSALDVCLTETYEKLSHSANKWCFHLRLDAIIIAPSNGNNFVIVSCYKTVLLSRSCSRITYHEMFYMIYLNKNWDKFNIFVKIELIEISEEISQ